MKKFLLMLIVVCMAMIVMAAGAKRPVLKLKAAPEEKATWVTTVTTNEMGGITKVATNQKTGEQIFYIFGDINIPIKWRVKFAKLTPEEQAIKLVEFKQDAMFKELPFNKVVKPVEAGQTDDNTSAEMRVIETR